MVIYNPGWASTKGKGQTMSNDNLIPGWSIPPEIERDYIHRLVANQTQWRPIRYSILFTDLSMAEIFSPMVWSL